MALINCPECGRQVSSVAQACPGCGYPIATMPASTAAPRPDPAPEQNANDALLLEVRPSWWGYFWLLLFAWLIVPFIVAWWRRRSVVLRVYPGRIALERGMMRKCYREYAATDVRSLDIDQGLLQRMLDIGDLTISTAATIDASERIDGIPQPKAVRDLIVAQRGLFHPDKRRTGE